MISNRVQGVALLAWCGLLVGVVSAEDRPTPIWIWGSDGAQSEAPVGQCEFRRQFEISDVAQAKLEVTCDDRYVLRLNGRVIGLGANWQQWDAYDVAPLLKDGKNEILLRCRNDASAAGLVLNLEVEKQDGTRWHLVTDGRWQSRLQRAGTWDPGIVDRTPWEAARELIPYGPDHGRPWRAIKPATTTRKVRASNRSATDPFELVDGDRVLFLGNTFVERSQQYGHLEAALTAAFPTEDVIYRNLGWSGDTVFGHARARFGTVQDGFQHLETHVFGENPTVVFVAYGTNESFKGEAGLREFSRGLGDLVDVVSATGAYVVLVTPVPHENLGPPLPDASKHNAMLAKYRDVIVRVGNERGCGIVDLFERLPQIKQAHAVDLITENGMHLGDLGYWYAAQAMLAELGVEAKVPELVIDAESNQAVASGAEIQNVSVANNRVALEYRADRIRIGVPTPPTESTPVEAADVVLRVKGLAAGSYSLVVDGAKVARANAEEWARGISVPTSDQAAELLERICKKNELYFHRWRPQNETYLFLFRKHEQGNNAVEIPQFDPLVEEVEQTIATLRTPRKQAFELIAEPE